jgi:lysophospholipid hydrolase
MLDLTRATHPSHVYQYQPHLLCSPGRLDSGSLEAGLGPRIHDTFAEAAISGWLANKEDANDVVLYVADDQDSLTSVATPWTRRCIRQADLVLFVAMAHVHPGPGEPLSPLETDISSTTNARQELVILHFDPSADYMPTDTKDFLASRRVQRHHHLRVHTDEAGLLHDRSNVHSDFARLGRWLTGRSVGLVLGGGGARGCSHLGVMNALELANVPVDLVGGTSIGSFMGSIRSGTTNYKKTKERGRAIGNILGSYWAYLKDLTLPYVSFFSGSGMNNELQLLYGADVCIEDLWLPFYAVTTSVNHPSQVPHSITFAADRLVWSNLINVRATYRISFYTIAAIVRVCLCRTQ